MTKKRPRHSNPTPKQVRKLKAAIKAKFGIDLIPGPEPFTYIPVLQEGRPYPVSDVTITLNDGKTIINNVSGILTRIDKPSGDLK